MSTRFLLLFACFLYIFPNYFGQCSLTVQSTSTNIGCGDCVSLSAQGQVLNPVFEEDFNNGQPVGWDFSQVVIT